VADVRDAVDLLIKDLFIFLLWSYILVQIINGIHFSNGQQQTTVPRAIMIKSD